jgi:hypothetical protein
MDELGIKKIISKFLFCKPQDINEDTIIDASTIKGSVLILRMYSRLNEFFETEINDFQYIVNYGDLLNELRRQKLL